MKTFVWKKGGFIFAPKGDRPWALTNASFPTVERINDVIFRIYYSALDHRQRGRVGFIDVSADDPRQILAAPDDPILDVGAPGAFDADGVNVFSVVTSKHDRRLYYQGWHPRADAPYGIFSGVAVGTLGGARVAKISDQPILGARDGDQYLRCAPFVMRDGDIYKMWYASCREWIERRGKVDYRVRLAYLESQDGLTWTDAPTWIFEPSGDDYAIGRPCVLKIESTYHMWYSVRSFTRPYRLGYAYSPDGRTWTRHDDLMNLTPGPEAWDSDMLAYPCVVRHRDELVMFYNGNVHGRTGFGFATASL